MFTVFLSTKGDWEEPNFGSLFLPNSRQTMGTAIMALKGLTWLTQSLKRQGKNKYKAFCDEPKMHFYLRSHR